MKIIEMKERTPLLVQQLLEIWESSVRATHLFLSDSEIEKIKGYVPQAIREIPHLIVGEDDRGIRHIDIGERSYGKHGTGICKQKSTKE